MVARRTIDLSKIGKARVRRRETPPVGQTLHTLNGPVPGLDGGVPEEVAGFVGYGAGRDLASRSRRVR